jgi:hypothetical protein
VTVTIGRIPHDDSGAVPVEKALVRHDIAALRHARNTAFPEARRDT